MLDDFFDDRRTPNRGSSFQLNDIPEVDDRQDDNPEDSLKLDQQEGCLIKVEPAKQFLDDSFGMNLEFSRLINTKGDSGLMDEDK